MLCKFNVNIFKQTVNSSKQLCLKQLLLNDTFTEKIKASNFIAQCSCSKVLRIGKAQSDYIYKN